MRAGRSARWDIHADAAIVSMSPDQAIPRHGCIPVDPTAVSPGKIIVPRIVIGGVILDQPAGGGIGAVGVGSPCAYGGHGRSRPRRDKNALDPARSRLWSVLSVKLEKYLSRPDYEGHISFIETFHEGFQQDGIGCPDAFPVELKPGTCFETVRVGSAMADAGLEVPRRRWRPRFCDLETAELWAGLVRRADGQAAARGLLTKCCTSYGFLYRIRSDCPCNRDG